MGNLAWIQMLTWALAVFFAAGFVINALAAKLVGLDYRRWGFPLVSFRNRRTGTRRCAAIGRHGDAPFLASRWDVQSCWELLPQSSATMNIVVRCYL